MTSARPIVIAHRGASGYRPEHTRSAFRLAISMGVDAVEPDLVASRDGVLVVRHEAEISGTTDVASRHEFAHRRTTKTVDGVRVTGWFTEDFTWAELATLTTRERLPEVRPRNTDFDGTERMLRLEDLLEILDEPAGAEVALVAELKHASRSAAIGLPLDRLFASALSAAGWDDPVHRSRVTVESFELTVLDRMHGKGAGHTLVYLLEPTGSPADRPDRAYASYLTDSGLAELAGVVHGISVDKRVLLDADADAATRLVERAHAAGLLVYCWTLRAENRFLARRFRGTGPRSAFGDWEGEFDFLLSRGVDGVFADQPDLALAARQSARMA